MGQYSKKRGVIDAHEKLTSEEKRQQWNVNMAKRTLENMFQHTEIDENTYVSNRKIKRVTYNPQTLYEKAQEYFENILEANENGVTIIPDIEDFCLFAHISRAVFLSYRKSDNVEMADVANYIATAIAGCKKQNAYAGLINPIAFAMDMNNNHDYVQSKTETTINSNISLSQIEANVADIASRIPVEDIPLIESSLTKKKGEDSNE